MCVYAEKWNRKTCYWLIPLDHALFMFAGAKIITLVKKFIDRETGFTWLYIATLLQKFHVQKKINCRTRKSFITRTGQNANYTSCGQLMVIVTVHSTSTHFNKSSQPSHVFPLCLLHSFPFIDNQCSGHKTEFLSSDRSGSAAKIQSRRSCKMGLAYRATNS